MSAEKTSKADVMVVDGEVESESQDDEEKGQINVCNPFVEKGLLTEEEFPANPYDMWYGESCVVRYTARNGGIPVCDFIVVSNKTFDVRTGEWGLITWHFNSLGELVELFHKASDLVNPKALASRLMSAGLQIYGGGITHTLAFINGMRLNKDRKVKELISRPGWHKTLQGESVYARPDVIISASDTSDLIFQPASPSPIYDAYHSRGELNDWKRFIHRPLSNSEIPMFVQSASLSGVLLSRLGLPSFAADINGPSTTGKTSVVQSAVSQHGNAEDTATANGTSCIQVLKTTDNAFEHLAAHSNDGVLALDETGNSNIKDMTSLLYFAIDGTGKARMNMDTSLRDTMNFNAAILFSGERSIHTYTKNSLAGHYIRVLDINVSVEGAIKARSIEEAAQIAASVKDASGKYYGKPVIIFINWLVNQEKKNPLFFEEQKQRFKEIHEELTSQPMTAQQSRGCQWFAISILASELACASRIYTRRPAHYAALIKMVMQRWLTTSVPISDAERAVQKLKRFIITNPNRFPDAIENKNRPNGIVGFKRANDYLLSSESLVDVSGGLADAVSIARELKRQKFLNIGNLSKGSLQRRATVTGVGRGVYYSIKKLFLSDKKEKKAKK